MSHASFDTTQLVQRRRFQYSLRQLMIFSIVTGAGIMYSPFGTLVVLFIFVLPAVVIRSWYESTVVTFMILILMSLILPFPCSCRTRAKTVISYKNIRTIAAALEQYHADFQSYPPEDSRSESSAESLVTYLCIPTSNGTKGYGPYMTMRADHFKDTDGDGRMELCNVRGKLYYYRLKSDSSPLVIDPGKDGLLGGTFSKDKGFVPDGSDADRDGDPDDKDNLYSSLNGR